MADTYIDEKDVKAVNDERDTAIKDSNTAHDNMISQADKYTEQQINAVKDWEKTQKDLQNEQTDLTIQQVNQQKDQARSDYLKEQSGAYKDWQKQSNSYGANAEAMAAQGMANSGYSESSQVSMYNSYQNRVATARETYSRAVLNYDNAITQARLANSSALAEIAYESLSKQLELSLTGFQYKNTLVLEKAKTAREISSDYWSRYRDLLSQINSQNNYDLNKKAYELDLAKFNYAKEQDAKTGSSAVPQIKKRSTSSSGNKRTGTKVKKSSGTQVKKTSNTKAKKTSKASPTVDMKSVLNLGYGPISPKKLNTLVKEGKAKETVKNGKLLYTKRFNY
jgi:hypothetical protein